ncbi:MAG TPA: MaoC/PaaZ C-terminal domain-containing protein [Propionibacteriaceae bacterium]|nr:MaoC/PaaZ C-terminal domain-containing protein [Propionibacteriaceae bacterium]
MARIELDALPGVGALLARGAATSFGRPSPEKAVLDRTVAVPGYRSEPDRLAAYSRVCGFTLRSHLPATWLHVLTFPLQAWIMSRGDFPFALAGILHVSNDMTLHRPVDGGEALQLEVGAANLRPHKRGVSFDLVGRALVDGELVWEGLSNYLARGKSVPGEPIPGLRLEAPDVEPGQHWHLPGDLGRQYAKVSGDVNPIHLHPLGARAFGLKRPIIHGMWTHARAMAALEGRLPDAHRVQVQFTKPLSLPGSARFGASESDAGTAFVVTDSDASRPYLIGAVTHEGGR